MNYSLGQILAEYHDKHMLSPDYLSGAGSVYVRFVHRQVI